MWDEQAIVLQDSVEIDSFHVEVTSSPNDAGGVRNLDQVGSPVLLVKYHFLRYVFGSTALQSCVALRKR